MAEKRMFTSKIVESDVFLDMPFSAQCLYFHLNMNADDDGFLNGAKRIQRATGTSESDLNLLIEKRFILSFDNGVIVIKHWRMNNNLRKDRCKPTQYSELFQTLEIQEDGSYTERLGCHNDNQMTTKCQPNGNQMATQYSIGKDSIDKLSIDKKRKDKEKKTIRHKYGEYKNVLLSDSDLEKLKAEFPSDYQDRIENLSSYMAATGKTYKNHLATIRNWARKEKPQQQPSKQTNQASGNPFLDIAIEENLF